MKTTIKDSDPFREKDAPVMERVRLDDAYYFRISDYDQMRPFFMSIVSQSDLWMFISSTGGLTAGRKNPEYALFPYYTDDKIGESSGTTGSKTIIEVEAEGKKRYWEPLSERFKGRYSITRNLYKSVAGNKIRFEEINHDLKLSFLYEWCPSERYGFVRKSCLISEQDHKVNVRLIDGIQNVLPARVGSELQLRSSNLVDAYKRNELVTGTDLATYSLSAFIVDKAEPSESLKANVAWSYGLDQPVHLLSSLQLGKFRQGAQLIEESDIKGEKGSYMVSTQFSLDPGSSKEWGIVADVNKDHASVIDLMVWLQKDIDRKGSVQKDINESTQRLISLVASSDGLQLTRDIYRNARHYSNTLFNIMRGGVFDHNYQINKKDFLGYLKKANSVIFKTHSPQLQALQESFSLFELRALIREIDDKDLLRLSVEYLPLKFSRRHGDPSRPWNKFSINIRDEHTGEKVLDYEGNWRDIFQNWEALAYSYPEFIEGMVFKFLNASTFDGYNPYRVTKDGFDWETIEPDDPWSYIGYWGDHQIIYLLKFLEFSQKHKPGKLAEYLDRDLFVYANVPYRIKSYADILKNPKDTIDFDHAADQLIREKRQETGSDGAVMRDEKGNIYRVNFIEKILATILAKLSNFIPEAGIWMNTQRPEWNDANNALVGNGASMVTLGYLRRMLDFLDGILEGTGMESVKISSELIDFYKRVRTCLEDHSPLLSGKINEHQRKQILDTLGQAGSDFRLHVYKKGLWGAKRSISISGLRSFIKNGLEFMDHSLAANKRVDGMYHAYNLVTISDEKGVEISYLSEMLEGQVSVLSSGYLNSREALEVLDALKASKLFRHDQYSYLLYPAKELPGFLKKNNIPKESIGRSVLLKTLVNEGNSQIVAKDALGDFHFHSRFHNSGDLETVLGELEQNGYAELVKKDRSTVLEIFEEIFDHKSFTGRSGTFFGYEGLGSIYWHMVSKLQLAVQECCLQAIGNGSDPVTIGRLLEHYYEINEGIGIHKPPLLYGAFSTDPYSHTPAGRGAQQPGMTGQVKEDILCRFGELGVFVREGHLVFDPCLLRKDEFVAKEREFKYFDLGHSPQQLLIKPGHLGYLYCQIPVIYKLGSKNSLTILKKDGSRTSSDSLVVDKESSMSVFRREGKIESLIVELDPTQLK